MREESKIVQIVWAHPREDSLTAQIVSDVKDVVAQHGHEIDEVDLYRLNFDPSLTEADEPDWANIDKNYDPETMELVARAAKADLLIYVFPVWWYSFPAILKGYIDRVWNYGTFYGEGRRIGIDSVLWLGLVGYSEEQFQKRQYDEMMTHYMNVGLAGYCGFTDSHVELMYNTLGEGVSDMAEYVATLRAQGRDVTVSALARAFKSQICE